VCGIDGYAVNKKLLKYCLDINEKFDVDSFDLKRPHDMEVKEQHQIHIQRRFATLINSDDTGRFKSVCVKMLQKRYK
jgi:hypothetical protein